MHPFQETAEAVAIFSSHLINTQLKLGVNQTNQKGRDCFNSLVD